MALLAIDLKPDRTLLKRFGFSALVVFAGIGALVLAKGGLLGFDFGANAPTIGWILVALGTLSAVFSLSNPSLNRPLYLGLVIVTSPIGFVLGWVILGIMWFLVITPTGLLMRLCGKDPMRRRHDPSASTYFDAREKQPEIARYFRQF